MARLARLHIANSLALPIDAVTETFAIIAMKGMGKTHTASVMAEEMLERGFPIGVVDPTDAWYGLRSSKDGKHPGYPITVLGGEHGDLPLDPRSGALIADLMVGENVSLILVTREMSKSDQIRFVTDFSERLYHKNRDPRHIFYDEADAFAPQKPRPEIARCLGAIDDIVRRGRNRGLGTSLITQRVAVLNKDVLSQAGCLIALRTTSVWDIEAIDHWIKVHDAEGRRERFLKSIPTLARGTAWIWSPGWLELFEHAQIRDRHTFDSSKTPKVGEKRVEPRKLAKVDLDRIQAQLKATLEESKASDPKTLRARIAELEAQLKTRPGRAAKQLPPQVVEKLGKREKSRLRKLAQEAAEIGTKLTAIHERIKSMNTKSAYLEQAAQELLAKVSTAPVAGNALAAVKVAKTLDPVIKSFESGRKYAADPNLRAGSNGHGSELTAGARRMLAALAHTSPLTKIQIGCRAGVHPGSGTFGNYLGALRAAGYIGNVPGGGIAITTEGIQVAAKNAERALSSKDELCDFWFSEKNLTRGEREMLACLRMFEAGLSKADLGAKAGIQPDSGTFGNYLGTLRSNGLAVYEDGLVKLGPGFEGLP